MNAPAPLGSVILGDPEFDLVDPAFEGLPYKVRVRQGAWITDTEDALYCRKVASVWLAAAQSLEAADGARKAIAVQLAPLPDAPPLPVRVPQAALAEAGYPYAAQPLAPPEAEDGPPEPQPGGTIYPELSPAALAGSEPLASLAPDPASPEEQEEAQA